MTKLCIMCKHFDIELDMYDAGGCPTCGPTIVKECELSCGKSHFSRQDVDEWQLKGSLRTLSKHAETCEDYEAAED